MASLKIPNLPADIHEALSIRARREGRTLAEQAISELRRLPPLEARQRRLDTIRQIRAQLDAMPQAADPFPSPEDLVREDRAR